jgi:hypothetical protein
MIENPRIKLPGQARNGEITEPGTKPSMRSIGPCNG